jgi:hypothetical protein
MYITRCLLPTSLAHSSRVSKAGSHRHSVAMVLSAADCGVALHSIFKTHYTTMSIITSLMTDITCMLHQMLVIFTVTKILVEGFIV